MTTYGRVTLNNGGRNRRFDCTSNSLHSGNHNFACFTGGFCLHRKIIFLTNLSGITLKN